MLLDYLYEQLTTADMLSQLRAVYMDLVVFQSDFDGGKHHRKVLVLLLLLCHHSPRVVEWWIDVWTYGTWLFDPQLVLDFAKRGVGPGFG